MGGVVFNDDDLEAVQVIECPGIGAIFAGEDDDGEVEVGAGEVEVSLALGRGHDAGKQVDFVALGTFEDFAPVAGLDGVEADVEAVLDEPGVVSGEALVATLAVAEFEGGPGGVDAYAQRRVGLEPVLFFLREGERSCAGHPE